MERIFTILCLISVVSAFAQAPEGISYQAVVRDAGGNPISNQGVSFRLSILQGSLSGTVVYSETHAVSTNEFGLANLEIGHGTVVSGSFSGISWGSNSYFLQTELDPAGGTAWPLMGTSQFFSVPYSLYSKTSGNGIPLGASGQTIRSDGSTWVPNSTLYNDGSRVGVGTSSPANSALMDMNSTNKGVVFPRMNKDQM